MATNLTWFQYYRSQNNGLVFVVFLNLQLSSFFRNAVIAAAASEPEANERGSSLINRRLHYRGLQSLFLTKRKELWLCANGRFRMRKELWLCANGRFRMRSGMPQGNVVMREWEDLGCAAYQTYF